MRSLSFLAALLAVTCGDTHGLRVRAGAPPDLRGQWMSAVLSDGSRLGLTIVANHPSISGRGSLFTRIVGNTESLAGPVIPVTVTGMSASMPITLELRYAIGGGDALMRFEVTAADSLRLAGILHEGGDYSERVEFVRQ